MILQKHGDFSSVTLRVGSQQLTELDYYFWLDSTTDVSHVK